MAMAIEAKQKKKQNKTITESILLNQNQSSLYPESIFVTFEVYIPKKCSRTTTNKKISGIFLQPTQHVLFREYSDDG